MSISRHLRDYVIGMPRWLDLPIGLLLLGIRLRLAHVFFGAGLLKLQGFETTLALFAYEYDVPLLPPDVAAWLATGAELLLPPLLALGLFTRPAALALFVFNAVAAVSYPDISEAGAKDHVYWGVLFGLLALQGGGLLSLDRLLTWRLRRRDARDGASKELSLSSVSS